MDNKSKQPILILGMIIYKVHTIELGKEARFLTMTL